MNATTPKFVPTMRRVERSAMTTINKCLRKEKLKAIPMPVPVEMWIEGPLGIRFGIADLSHLSKDGNQVLGAASIVDREIMVSDGIKNEGRIRFTAAHELGHLVLHAGQAVMFRDGPQVPDRTLARMEFEADRFAAAFLAPLPLLCPAFAGACERVSIAPSDAFDGLHCGEPGVVRLWRSEILPQLSARFVMSLAAMANRFGDLLTPLGRPLVTRDQLGALRIIGAGSSTWITN